MNDQTTSPTKPYTQRLVSGIQSGVDEKYLFGQADVLELLLIAWLSNGHVLLEGPPGTAKTMTAKLLATLLSKSFQRIQFTSDMLPGDIIGAHIYNPNEGKFKFIQGPLFSSIVVADEINRAPPRTQSALLEAMEERQVTTDGVMLKLSPDFFVIATQNPQDYEGTFPLPEVQLDRFLFKIKLEHADQVTEQNILRETINGTLPPKFDRIRGPEIDMARLTDEIAAVKVDPSILKFITGLLAQTRNHPMLQAGCSIRGGIALIKAARVRAIAQGRSFVTPDDVKTLIHVSLRHRIRLRPEAQVSHVTEDQILNEAIEKVGFPN